MMNNGARTILVVDDDDDLREILSLVLGLNGMKVVSASNGIEALAQVRSHEDIGLVLLDLMMPDLNGADVLEAMRRDPRLSSIRVLVLSGDRCARETASSLGADGCLSKPIEIDVLLREIRRVLPPAIGEPQPAAP